MIVAVMLTVLLAASVGATAAIWSGEGEGEGYAPGAAVADWNVWAKYFDGVIISETEKTAAVTGYGNNNLEDVIIPESLILKNTDGEAVECRVVEIRNTVFQSVTLKALPVTVYISPYVTKIEAGAFANLPNLKKVVFGSGKDSGGYPCVVSDYAFMNCTALETITVEDKTKTLSIAENAFLGCVSLSNESRTIISEYKS